MNAILVDSGGQAGGRSPSPRAAVAGAIVLASLGLSGLGFYWMSASAPASAPAAETVAAAPAEEPLLTAPPPTCVDGSPTRPDVPADACL